MKISYVKNEGQVVNYFHRAIYQRYLELYKKSVKLNNNECISEEYTEIADNVIWNKNECYDVIIKEDTKNIIDKYEGVKKEIVYMIMVENISDIEIGNRLNISRQYVNKVRRKLRDDVRNYF